MPLLTLLAALACHGRTTPQPPPEPVHVDAWVEAKAAAARAEGVRPNNEERLVRQVEGPTPLAVLYIHGFGASRGEGQAVVEPMAEALGANLYYTRLPGHGVDDPELMDAPHWRDYLDVVDEAFARTRELGERVLVVGSSTGGLLATWLAAQHPDAVYAQVLASPFYAFADPSAKALDVPGGFLLVRLIIGKYRDTSWPPERDPEGRKQPGYEGYWTTTQRTRTLKDLAALRRHVARDEVYARVTAPTLMLAHYADEAHQDDVVSVAVMREAFAQLGADSAPSPLNRFVEIADGNHILTSEYVRSDKEAVRGAIEAFLASLGHEVDL